MYRIRLPDFQGPLDLLLFFIQRDELDVYDIPIARITDEYLAYVRVLEQVDLDVAGDFIYMAALLIQIKARMLLPSPDVDEAGELVDPRQELVERLLEYVRFKQAAHDLSYHLAQRADQFTRADVHLPAEVDVENREVLVGATVFDLISALRRVLTVAPEEPTHAVQRVEYSMEEQQAFVLAQLRQHPRLSFVALVRQRGKPFVIATFLAVLELARQGLVGIALAPAGSDFYVDAVSEGVGDPPANGAPPTNGTEHP
jgi:segregation and condensation protein A